MPLSSWHNPCNPKAKRDWGLMMNTKQSDNKNGQELSVQMAANGRQSGFTLIEMMITVSIIGILSAFAMVAYQVQVRQSQLTTMYHELNGFRLPYQVLMGEGAGVTDFSPNGLNLPSSTHYCQFTVKAPNIGSDTADAVVCNIQNLSYLQNQSLSLTFTKNGSWQCKASSGISASYLPQACRP